MALNQVDDIAPRVLVLPVRITGDANAHTGEIQISGGKLHFLNGTDWDLVTSA